MSAWLQRAVERFAVWCIASAAVSANCQQCAPADGVQRVPDEVFLSYNISWIDRWRATQLPFIQKQEGRVVLMLVVFRGRNADTLALVDCTHPGDRTSRKPTYFTLCRIVGDAPTIRATRAAVTGKVAMSLVQTSWSLVENPPLDAQEINAATDENEIWYLFARKLDNDGIVRSKLHVAQGINPPEGGLLRTLREDLERCADVKDDVPVRPMEKLRSRSDHDDGGG